MKYSFQTVTLAFLTIFIAGCATTGRVDIRTIEAPEADFSDYQTFYVLPEPPIGNGANTVVRSYPRQVVETAVRRELSARKYREIKSKDNADMLVAIQFSLKDEKRERTVVNNDGYYNNSYRRGGYGHGYGYRNYYGYRTFSSTSIQVESFRKGNMIIDIIDRKENALAWEAFAAGEGETELDAIQAKVNRVVAEIFVKYPYTAGGVK